jgi:hypothetical protein
MSTTKFCERVRPVADAARARYDPGAMEETVTSRVAGVAQVFDLNTLKAFAPNNEMIFCLRRDGGARLDARGGLAVGNRHGGLAGRQEIDTQQASSCGRPE